MKDLLAVATAREREFRRPFRAPEIDSFLTHVFRCVVCNRIRPDEQRREPQSRICVKCVQEAGFDLDNE